MNTNERLASHVVTTTFAELPREVIEIAKKDVFDTLGVAIAASGEAGGKELMEMMGPMGGKPESTIIGYGTKLPVHVAALINGTTAHSLDYDDVTLSTGHIGVIIVPTAFAVAEHVGKVSGKELITAIVLGHDVACRLGEASKPLALGPGWLYTPLYGIFGAAATAGKLLGLNEEQMANAFGIAYAQAAGNRQSIVDGALSKRMAAGFANQAGVLSALAASYGLTGARDCFEGKFGLFHVYHRGEYKPEALTADLGKYFTITTVSFKHYPSCTATETSIEATLELMKRYCLTADGVERVVVHVPEHAVNSCQPLEHKQNPRNEVDAQFSIPWVVATALRKGKVTIEDMSPKAIQNESVRELARKVTPLVDMEVSGDIASFPAVVEITTKAGEVYTRREDVPRGHPDKPLNWEDLFEKFDACVAKKHLSKQTVSALKEQCCDLEHVEDVRRIVELLG